MPTVSRFKLEYPCIAARTPDPGHSLPRKTRKIRNGEKGVIMQKATVGVKIKFPLRPDFPPTLR